MSEDSSPLVKMPCTSLLFFVIITNFILLGDGKPIEDPSFQSEINTASKSRNQLVDESFRSNDKLERSSGKVGKHDTCIGNCNRNNPKVLSETKQLCPYENKELCLIFSLSKIAKVQVATFSQASTDRSLKLDNFDGGSKDTKNSKSYEELRHAEDSFVDFSKRNEGGSIKNFSRNQVNSTNVYCRAIQDVYIPEVKQHLPAFACKLRNNTFILSSERFLQDRRLYLDIKVDEDIFKSTKPSPKILRSSEYSAVPALLILNAVTNDYRIEMHKTISGERGIIQTAKDR